MGRVEATLGVKVWDSMGPKKHWRGEVLEKSLDESLEALYRLNQPGAVVPIEMLARKLQISRADAIERIVRLQALGFVTSSPALELALTHS